MSKDSRITDDVKQWVDPGLLTLGSGNEAWARWATKFLYANCTPESAPSTEWPRTGLITQFDRTISIPLAASDLVNNVFITNEGTLQTNNRNWLLLSRAATAHDANGTVVDLNRVLIRCEVPPQTALIETQPAGLVFGSGEWPANMPYPEEWSMNVARTWFATNLLGQAITLDISLKFLMVRTN